MRLSDSYIERFIEEDLPYEDPTTHLLGIGDLAGRIIFATRHGTTLCGTVAQSSGTLSRAEDHC